ncbi:MAG: nucleotide exchange factor GrpE [bacterium]
MDDGKKPRKMASLSRGKENKIEKIKTEEIFKAEVKEASEKYLRALADYQNLLKRSAEEKTEFVKYANEELILAILPVYDNLKISMEHLDEEAKKSAWAEGVGYVIKQFEDVLKNFGVEKIKTEKEKFDPEFMEAIDGEGDKVKNEIKSGHKLNGRVIVPAKVVLE